MKLSNVLFSLSVLMMISCKDDIVDQTPIVELEENVFKKKVLVEKISSVNCGSCPLAQYELEELKKEYDEDLVYVSHYLFGALNHEHTQILLSKIDKTYFTPLSLVNRRENGEGTVFFQLYAWKDEIESGLSEVSDVGIALNSVYENERVELEVEIMTNNPDMSDPRLHVYVVEKSVIGEGPDYDQKNYGYDDPNSPYYQQGEFIEGFEHKNILRNCVSSADGEPITWQNSMAKFSFSFDFQLVQYTRPEDFSIIAFVASGEVPNHGTIENTQVVNLGETVDMFE